MTSVWPPREAGEVRISGLQGLGKAAARVSLPAVPARVVTHVLGVPAPVTAGRPRVGPVQLVADRLKAAREHAALPVDLAGITGLVRVGCARGDVVVAAAQ